MKEENFLRRRFSLCPASSTPQKVDPRKLTRNLFFGADNDIYPLSPGWFLGSVGAEGSMSRVLDCKEMF